MRQRPEAVCTIILIAVNVAVFFILSLFGDTEDAVFHPVTVRRYGRRGVYDAARRHVQRFCNTGP